MLLLWLNCQKTALSRRLAWQDGGIKQGSFAIAPHVLHAGPRYAVFLCFPGPCLQKTVHSVLTTSCIFPATGFCWPAFPQGMSIPKHLLMLRAILSAHLSSICPEPQVNLTQLPLLQGLRVPCWNTSTVKYSSFIMARGLLWLPKLPTKGQEPCLPHLYIPNSAWYTVGALLSELITLTDDLVSLWRLSPESSYY